MKKLYFVSLLLCSCIFFDNITQPSSVTVGERFTITITGNYTPAGCPGTWWLAMRMPVGFEIDSIRYLSSDSLTGLVTDMDYGLCHQFETNYPCSTNMCWLAYSVGGLSADSSGTFLLTVYVCPSITTCAGQYQLDYYIGHFIGCGSSYVDSLLDLPMTVESAGITQGSTTEKNRAQRIFPSIFHQRLNIHTQEPGMFNVYSSSGRLIRRIYVEEIGSWDGTDSYGAKVPTGNYFIKANGITTKVTLLE